MHHCPFCGMPCYCSGDIDDVEVMSQKWVINNCQCDCDYFEAEESWQCCAECDIPDACADFWVCYKSDRRADKY